MPELFHAEIDVHFYADDIDDALQKLADHLTAPWGTDDDDPDEPELFIAPSRVDIQSVESED